MLRQLLPAQVKKQIRKLFPKAPPTQSIYPYTKKFTIHGLEFVFNFSNSTATEWYDYDNALFERLAEPRALMNLLQAGDRVLEIGCHHGFYSCIISSIIGPGGRLVALDAFAQNTVVTQSNFALNGFQQSTAYNIAGARTSGEVEFACGENGSVRLAGETWHTGEVIHVPAMSVDDLVAKYGPFDAIKIDVEGLEQQVLEGAQNFLQSKPKIILEVHRDSMLDAHGGSTETILALLPIEQYTGEIFYKDSMDKLHTFEATQLLSTGDFNLFLKPRD